jgi:hypothetical protein
MGLGAAVSGRRLVMSLVAQRFHRLPLPTAPNLTVDDPDGMVVVLIGIGRTHRECDCILRRAHQQAMQTRAVAASGCEEGLRGGVAGGSGIGAAAGGGGGGAALSLES